MLLAIAYSTCSLQNCTEHSGSLTDIAVLYTFVWYGMKVGVYLSSQISVLLNQLKSFLRPNMVYAMPPTLSFRSFASFPVRPGMNGMTSRKEGFEAKPRFEKNNFLIVESDELFRKNLGLTSGVGLSQSKQWFLAFFLPYTQKDSFFLDSLKGSIEMSDSRSEFRVIGSILLKLR